MNRIYVTIFSVLFIACNPQRGKGEGNTDICFDQTSVKKALKLSPSELYSYKNLNGKLVSVEGFFSYNMEDIAVYPNRENLDQKGVWLDFDDSFLQNDSLLIKLNGKRIIVTGTIDTFNKGHLSSYFCTLSNISCVREKR